jgi:MazG family protein
MDFNRLSRLVVDLVELVDRLRGPGGCPWDAQQTDASIKMYLLEEAFEVLEAVERGESLEVCGELGDLLFQILFLTKLAEEREEFDFSDVVERITEKMIRRHPHVFGEAQVEGPDEVARNWARIKREEQGEVEKEEGAMKGIPLSLPALLRAHRMLERALKETSDPGSSKDRWQEVEKAFDSLRRRYKNGQRDLLGDSVGRLLFALVDFSREQGSNAEELLRMTNQRFLQRIQSGRSAGSQGGKTEPWR